MKLFKSLLDKATSNLICMTKASDSDSDSDLAPISAIYRVKNAESSIKLAIESISKLVEEIIFVDNGSTDNTLYIVEELATIYNIKIYKYEIDLCMAGEKYNHSLKVNPTGSLADYYNYAFCKGSSKYLMKCDANTIYTPYALERIKKAINSEPDVISYSGVDCFGDSHVLEKYIFRRELDWNYIDGDYWEQLEIRNKNLKHKKLFENLFYHVKRYNYVAYINEKSTAIEALYDKRQY